MKVLFIGDYSGFHATIARQLRSMGHEVVVASDGGAYMDTTRDIDISRKSGLAGAMSYMSKLINLLPSLSGYDVVQIINPNFLHLRPGKIRYFFKQLKNANGRIFLSLAGPDPVTVKACVEDGLYRYSEYRIGTERAPFAKAFPLEERQWINGRMGDHCRFVYENIDGAISALYEYHLAAQRYLPGKVTYGGIPVDTSALQYSPFEFPDGKVNMLVGVKKEYELFKGTDILYDVATEVARRHPDKCRAVKVENLSLTEYMQALRASHIVLDQLYSYTPATNALQAMALGRVAVSGAEPEFYDFIGERELHPIINVTPLETREELIDKLAHLILNPDCLSALGKESRKFVETHNSAATVADRFMKAWEKCHD